MIKEYPAYFASDIAIWLLAHNIPLLMAYLLKLYFDTKYKDKLIVIIFIYSALFLSRQVLIKIGANIDIRSQHKWSKFMYEKIIDKCLESKYISEAMSQNFMDVIKNDIGSIVGIISYCIDTFCSLVGSIIAFLIIATINIYIALILLIVPILIFFILNFLRNKLYDKKYRIRESESSLINIYQDIIIKSRKIHLEASGEDYYSSYNQQLKNNKSNKLNYGKFNILINTINQILVDSNVVIVLLAAIYFESFSVGDIALLISYSFIINDLSTYVSTFIVVSNELKVNLDSLNDKIIYKFQASYANTNMEEVNQILNSLEIGHINILIGKNGSGKTRLLKKISIDKNYPLILERSRVLAENLYENITLDKDAIIFDKLIKILGLEDLKSRHRLTNNDLSGGQIDRIALGRVLVADHRVILIDSNLMSVDNKIRLLILKNFEDSKRTFLITDTENREEYKTYNKIYI